MESNSVALAAIGLASTSVLGVLWIAKYSVKKLSKDFGEHTKAAIGIKQVIEKSTDTSKDQVKSNQYVAQSLILRADGDKTMAKALERVATATERAADEAKERNGHLAEISIQNKDAILKAIQSIMVNQSVKEQSVEHQVVKNKE